MRQQAMDIAREGKFHFGAACYRGVLAAACVCLTPEESKMALVIAGVLAAVIHARATGEGQLVDAAMTDGAAYPMTMFYGMHAAGTWEDRRRSNLLDGGAPFYDTYRCADGKWISVGALEPQFYALLLQKTGAAGRLAPPQMERKSWPDMQQVLREVFATGATFWKIPMPASLQSRRSRKRRRILTIARAARSSSWRESFSPRLLRAFPRRPAEFSGHRPP
jgi:crotonobetainyl-CoA:carnitine CoA-transferase CaiB-like acyl-CoA transferase